MNGNRQRVLVIDDDPRHSAFICQMLVELGADPASANSEQSAQSSLEKGGIDLVLLDVFLTPGLPEYEASLAVAGACMKHGVPCVAVSSLADWKIVERFEQAGCLEFVEKHSTGDILDRARLTYVLNAVRQDPDAPWQAYGLMGRSTAMRGLWQQIEIAAAGHESVLVLGPTGAGKELVARAIHRLSDRGRNEPLVLNCASLPDTLVEAELFGFVKGCFTGAAQALPGWFESAQGSSLILDEIGDLSLSAQAKVLRALEQGEIQRIGARSVRKPDVRLFYVTHQNLMELQRLRRLRDDFRYRLENSHQVLVPPLSDHKEDIRMPIFFILNCGYITINLYDQYASNSLAAE